MYCSRVPLYTALQLLLLFGPLNVSVLCVLLLVRKPRDIFQAKAGREGYFRQILLMAAPTSGEAKHKEEAIPWAFLCKLRSVVVTVLRVPCTRVRT